MSNLSGAETPSGKFDPRNTRISYENSCVTISSPDGSTRYYRFKKGRTFLLDKEILSNGKVLKTSCGLSSLWDGKPTSRVRSGEDFTLLYGKRLSLHLMIQEIVLTSILNNPILTSQGLLARCLIVFPASMVGKREYQAINPFDHPY